MCCSFWRSFMKRSAILHVVLLFFHILSFFFCFFFECVPFLCTSASPSKWNAQLWKTIRMKSFISSCVQFDVFKYCFGFQSKVLALWTPTASSRWNKEGPPERFLLLRKNNPVFLFLFFIIFGTWKCWATLHTGRRPVFCCPHHSPFTQRGEAKP